jgi:hypothetical protein
MRKNKIKLIEKRNIIKKIDFFTFGFIFALSVTIISSISSIYFTLHISNSLKNMYELDIAGAHFIQKALVNRLNSGNELKIILLDEKNESEQRKIDNIISYKNEFLKNMENAEPLFSSDTGKKYFKDAKISSEKYFKIIDALLSVIKDGKKETVLKSLKSETKAGLDLDQKLERMDNLKQRKNLKFYSTLIIILQTNLLIIVSILLISIVVRILFFIKQKKIIKHM